MQEKPRAYFLSCCPGTFLFPSQSQEIWISRVFTFLWSPETTAELSSGVREGDQLETTSVITNPRANGCHSGGWRWGPSWDFLHNLAVWLFWNYSYLWRYSLFYTGDLIGCWIFYFRSEKNFWEKRRSDVPGVSAGEAVSHMKHQRLNWNAWLNKNESTSTPPLVYNDLAKIQGSFIDISLLDERQLQENGITTKELGSCLKEQRRLFFLQGGNGYSNVRKTVIYNILLCYHSLRSTLSAEISTSKWPLRERRELIAGDEPSPGYFVYYSLNIPYLCTMYLCHTHQVPPTTSPTQ